MRLFALLPLFAALAPAAEPTADQLAFFEEKVRPVLAESCFACHSEAAPTPFAGLKLDSREALEQGGDHGPVIEPGEPDASALIQAVRHETIQMPPAGKLPDKQIAALVRWVEMGAPYPDAPSKADVPLGPNPARAKAWETHWAWQPIEAPEPPAVSDREWPSHPLDRFILARLEAENLAPSAPADRRTLLRRLSYDLIGLPPTAEQIAAFEADREPDAAERVVDDLLTSPHFGERWGRYWLDLARYSDTGAQNMRFPAPWSYRDWVVEALNRDLPYDRFIELQLAADQLELEDPADERALGLITLGINLPRPTDVPENVDDRIDVVTRSFLGLTVACARCHDHKYDPIPTADYYSLYGVFENSPDALEPLPVEPAKPSDPRADFYRERLRVRRQALDDFRQERLDELIAEFRSADWIERHLLGAWRGRDMTNTQVENLARENNLELYLLKRWRSFLNEQREAGTGLFAPFAGEASPNAIVAEAVAGAESAEQLAARYAELLDRYDRAEPYADPDAEQLRLALRDEGTPTAVPFEDFWWIMTEGDSNTVKNLRWQYHGVAYDWSSRGGPRLAMTIDEREKLEPAYIFRRGNQHDKGARVPRRFLSLLAGEDAEEFEHGAGRLDLARAITDPENPLTARVAVNRVWQHLFGAGLVRTPSDFGLRGDAPTHPELLDYLARSFVRDGWSLKRLIRRIVLSSTYRQSSAARPDAAKVDPENKLLARMPRRRLDFEALRDSLLAVAGRLEPRIGGASFTLGAQPAAPRRTLYAMVDRDALDSTLKNFDFPDPNAHTPDRSLTTVPQQALYLMNSPFAADQTRRLAALAAEAGDGAARVHALYRRVLGREATAEELDLAQTFLASRPARDSPETKARATPWRYGSGALDPASGRVRRFEEFEVFADDAWQAGWALPAPEAGYASLHSGGGAPGDDIGRAVIRRWVAPRDATLRIEGRLRHPLRNFAERFDYSNGIRGWIVSSRQGVLAQWTLRGATAETGLSGIKVEKGEALDFVVDARGDYEADDFTWAPKLTETSGEATWDAAADFAGPVDQPLDAWERYTQALLMTNEFLFVD